MVIGLLLVFNHQGGKQKVGEQKQSDPNNLETTTNKVIFPIAFTSNHVFHTFGIIASDTSIFWGNSGASTITRRISKIDIFIFHCFFFHFFYSIDDFIMKKFLYFFITFVFVIIISTKGFFPIFKFFFIQ